MAKCLHPMKITIKRKEGTLEDKATQINAACRKCYNCQMNIRRGEIVRVVDEAKYYKYHLMLTLTYDNKNIRLIDMITPITDKYVYTEKYKRLNEVAKIVQFIRNYELNNKDEAEKFVYYYLINQYATLCYKDIQIYLNTVKHSIKRDKTIEDRDFKYYGCGEYPAIKINRGRPHYHILYMFNDIGLIKYFIRAWNLGNITVKRGDNQIDESLILLTLPRQLNNGDKLNCICKQDTKNNDIARIYDYINNKKLKLDTNNNTIAEIRYIAGYTNKKAEAILIDSIYKRNSEISQYWYYKDLLTELEYKDIRNIMKSQRLQMIEDRKAGITPKQKEEPFRFKSQKLGYRHAIDNRKQYINNPVRYVSAGKGTKPVLLPDYYIKVIQKYEEKNNYLEKDIILYNKNKIVSELKIQQVEDFKERNKDIEYEIIRYSDNSVDIIDTTKDDAKKNIYMCEQEKIKFNQMQKEAKIRMFGDKDYKSDIFKTDFRDLQRDLKKYNNDIQELLNKVVFEKKYN